MTHEPLWTLGRRIRQARKEAGYTNTETLAVEIGVGNRTVQRWETDKSDPSIEKLAQIAWATRKPLSYFLDGVQIA